MHQPPLPDAAPLAPLAPVEPVALSPIDLDLVRRQIDAFAPRACQTQVSIEPLAAEGDPAREILTAAESADLIVMGTHGRSGFERLVLGSVTETVSRSTRG